ncbi:hypothetical protein [Nonomuraea sp. NPDC001023]|uniref:hypothetical protein n=1 Tax=unclassified Nonomuraea TaxID=2593643 RepID=UPI0033231F89
MERPPHKDHPPKETSETPPATATLAAALLLATAPLTPTTQTGTAPIVHAWGYNFFGQVGNGTNDTPVTHPIPMASTGGHDVTQTSGVYLESYALHTDGTVWTWGNGTQQIPRPATPPPQAPPVDIVVAVQPPNGCP